MTPREQRAVSECLRRRQRKYTYQEQVCVPSHESFTASRSSVSSGVALTTSANFLSSSLAVAETEKYETCFSEPSRTALCVW